MNNEPIITMRADASAGIGAGHVTRCLALAQAWQDEGGQARLLCGSIPDQLRALIEDEGITIDAIEMPRGSREDALATRARLEETGAGALVLDGYDFDREYQTAVRSADIPLLIIDDDAQVGGYEADLILDPNPGAEPDRYEPRPADTGLLLGAGYTLLRREFRTFERSGKTFAGDDGRVLVTLGGGDAHRLLRIVLRGLARTGLEHLEVTVTAGGSNEEQDDLRRLAGELELEVNLRDHVSDMVTLMAGADFAISAGGSTCWELAFMGVPGLTIIRIENQHLIADELDSAGILVSLGEEAEMDERKIAARITTLLAAPERRAEMSRKGKALVDGQGALRVIQAIRRVMERG